MGQTSEAQAGPRKNYLCVQALRAVAATLVVLHHSISLWLDWIVKKPLEPHWINGAAGVDIFFVISGFVMAISLPGLAGKPNKAAVFLGRRITRIVPLYWAALTVAVAQIKLNAADSLHTLLTPWRVAASYLFIPANNGRGDIFPLLTVGWTLNYEVFFYLLFAVALALDISPLVFLTPVLTVVGVVGGMRQATWPDFTALASPLVIEFLYGVILAHFATRRKLPGRAWAAMLLAGGFLSLILMPQLTGAPRYLAWGLPAAAMVVGAVALEDKLGGRLPRWLLTAGDASYALYLTHNFILPHLGNALGKLHVTGIPALAACVVLGLGISFQIAVLIHRYVEKPLMDMFKKRREPAEKFVIAGEPPLAPVPVPVPVTVENI